MHVSSKTAGLRTLQRYHRLMLPAARVCRQSVTLPFFSFFSFLVDRSSAAEVTEANGRRSPLLVPSFDGPRPPCTNVVAILPGFGSNLSKICMHKARRLVAQDIVLTARAHIVDRGKPFAPAAPWLPYAGAERPCFSSLERDLRDMRGPWPSLLPGQQSSAMACVDGRGEQSQAHWMPCRLGSRPRQASPRRASPRSGQKCAELWPNCSRFTEDCDAQQMRDRGSRMKGELMFECAQKPGADERMTWRHATSECQKLQVLRLRPGPTGGRTAIPRKHLSAKFAPSFLIWSVRR